ncbi:hypothetical protein H4R33_006890 [Dimargaris cristalligena]|nr:hypothetical protein H4R33_006890 [Dimargaris cristalligena]
MNLNQASPSGQSHQPRNIPLLADDPEHRLLDILLSEARQLTQLMQDPPPSYIRGKFMETLAAEYEALDLDKATPPH